MDFTDKLREEHAKLAQLQAAVEQSVAVLNARMLLIIELGEFTIEQANEIVGADYFSETPPEAE